MGLQSITLKNYRSYTEASFEFEPGATIIIGPNACGKTNLLEAVYLLAQGSGFRVSDKDLIRRGADWARLDGVFDGQERVVKLQAAQPKTKKIFEIDASKKSRLSFEETVPVVLYEPEDNRLIHGSPERRRRFLNELLTQTIPEYRKTLLTYNRAHKQRNTLLKRGAQSSSLFAWNIVMARAAQDIVVWRRQLIDQLNMRTTELYSQIAGRNHTINLSYTAPASEAYMNMMLKKLEAMVDVDRVRGYTSFGPHRDDVAIKIDDVDASISASRGETRTITLALKVMEMNIIEEVRGKKAILLLDDVFSELDGTRRKMLTNLLSDHQACITTTDADVVGKKFTKLAQTILLS